MAYKSLKRRLAEAEPETPGASSSAATDTAPLFSRTGIRTRVEGTPAPDAEAEKPFNDLLVKKWGQGKLSSKVVLEMASAAEKQGAEGATSLGVVKHPRNAQRALMAALGLPKGAPSFTWAEVPTTAGPKSAHPFLLPHSWFEALFQQEGMWESRVAGSAGDAREFWNSMNNSVVVQEHPTMTPDMWHKCIPFGIHGDGGKFSHQDNLLIFGVNSLLGKGTTTMTRLLVTSIRKTELVAGSLDAILGIIAWSFNTMLTGLSPSLDWNGKGIPGRPSYLAGGHKGVLMSCRGDWEFYSNVLGLPSWQSNLNMCWMCAASSTISDLLFTDCSPTAGWRETRRDNDMYLADLEKRGVAPCALFKATGFRLEAIMVDVLHTVDLGITAHIAANIFWELVEEGVWGRTQKESVAQLMVELKTWYSKNPRLHRLQGTSQTKTRPTN